MVDSRQIMCPGKDSKRQIETTHARDYYTGREGKKSRMATNTFGMITWNDIEDEANYTQCGMQSKDQSSVR